eukprot:2325324-Prymnesium_polylepis.1
MIKITNIAILDTDITRRTGLTGLYQDGAVGNSEMTEDARRRELNRCRRYCDNVISTSLALAFGSLTSSLLRIPLIHASSCPSVEPEDLLHSMIGVTQQCVN